jgi:UrcA family protein
MILSSPAIAGPVDPGTRVVRYDDLDLSTVAGMKAIRRRIDNALNYVCFDPYGPGPAGEVNGACKANGRRSALAEVEIAAARQQESRKVDGIEQASAGRTPQPVSTPKP